jgi:hypothetical protein
MIAFYIPPVYCSRILEKAAGCDKIKENASPLSNQIYNKI